MARHAQRAHHPFVKVRVVCDSCEAEMIFCVRAPGNVPGPLRCAPGGGGGAGSVAITCGRCGHRCFLSAQQLLDAVARKAVPPWDSHIRADAIVIRA